MDVFDLRQWIGFESAGGQLTENTCVDQVVIDSRRISSPRALFVALKGKHVDGHCYIEQAAHAGAKFALVSSQWQTENIPKGITLLRVPDPLKAFQELAKAYRLQLPTLILGITGSFGKTMVKDLLYTLLSTQKCVAASPESFNSQIGVALSLFTLTRQHEFAIIEAAISQQAEMDALADMIRPNYTLLTPVGKKHLATLQDVSTLIWETSKLLKATDSQGWSLLPQDDLRLKTEVMGLACPHFFWDRPLTHLPHATLLTPASDSFLNYQINFPDDTQHQGQITAGYAYFLNLINMATKAAWLLGISSTNIRTILQNYQPEPTRTEIWKSPTGPIFINEPYCSDPQSLEKALQHFVFANEENRRIFVFGGMRQTAGSSSAMDYRQIAKILKQHPIHDLLLVGDYPFHSLIEELQAQPQTQAIEISAFSNYPEAFSYLQKHLHKGDIVLFKGERKIPLDLLTETFNDSLSNNQCLINLAAIEANLALLRQRLPAITRFMVIVKALAYGTDEVYMAKFLATCGIDILGVSYVDEGVALRRAGVHQAIFSINAAIYEVNKIIRWELEVGISDGLFVQALAEEAAKQHKRIKVHLHINTGMGRFGCRPEEALALARQVLAYPSLELEGIMTHFACADDPKEDGFTNQQVAVFDATIEQLAKEGIVFRWAHAANSSGSIRFSLPQYNMVRIGLAAYGLYVSDSVRQELDLRLALSLTSRIVGINICKKGETISYNRRYRVTRDVQKIAVLPIGYFDGIHRSYSGKAHVRIRGQKVPMVGSICMDYLMVDVTDIPHVKVGDQVLIFGEDEFGHYLSPEAFAQQGDSIVHELITCLGPRIQRIFIYEEGKQIR